MIKEALLKGFSVVFDDTNANSKNRKSILKLPKEFGCKATVIVFLTSIETCINRNLKRRKERQISLEIILEMSKFNPDKVQVGDLDEVKYVKQS